MTETRLDNANMPLSPAAKRVFDSVCDSRQKYAASELATLGDSGRADVRERLSSIAGKTAKPAA